MKIYELEPDVEYVDKESGEHYMIDSMNNVLLKIQIVEGTPTRHYCSDSYISLLAKEFEKALMEIDFKRINSTNAKAYETVSNILSKEYETLDQYEEVEKITDLQVAKVVIKRFLDKLNNLEYC